MPGLDGKKGEQGTSGEQGPPGSFYLNTPFLFKLCVLFLKFLEHF